MPSTRSVPKDWLLPVDLDLPLDVVVLAFEHVETLERQRSASQQSLDVVNYHLPRKSNRSVHAYRRTHELASLVHTHFYKLKPGLRCQAKNGHHCSART